MTQNLKYIVWGLVALITVVVGFIIYRMFFQFDGKEIKQYANDAAARYGEGKADAYKYIMDGVEYILGSHNLTQQVLNKARLTGIDQEQELVSSAVQQCKAFGYFKN